MDELKCSQCDRPMGEGKLEPGMDAFCSIECACYAGRFSVTKGWIRKEEATEKDDS